MTREIGKNPVPRTEVRGLSSDVYHVWFSPHRRRPILVGEVDEIIRKSIEDVAQERAIQIIEFETSYDHVHILIRLPDNLTRPQAIKYLKGVSSRRVMLWAPDIKFDLKSDHFWQRGYGFRRVEAGAIATMRGYIRNHQSHGEEEPRTSVRGQPIPTKGAAR